MYRGVYYIPTVVKKKRGTGVMVGGSISSGQLRLTPVHIVRHLTLLFPELLQQE